jgi:hypothetical protein
VSQIRKYTLPLEEALKLFCPNALVHVIASGPHINNEHPNHPHPHVKAFSSPDVEDSDIDDLIIRGAMIAQGKAVHDDGKNEIWAIWTWEGKFYAQALTFSPVDLDDETVLDSAIIEGLIPASTPLEVKGYGIFPMTQHMSDRLALHVTKTAKTVLSIKSTVDFDIVPGKQHRTFKMFEWACFRFISFSSQRTID